MSTAKEWLEAQSVILPKCRLEWTFAYPGGGIADPNEVGKLTEADARGFVEFNPNLKLMQRTVTEWYEVE